MGVSAVRVGCGLSVPFAEVGSVFGRMRSGKIVRRFSDRGATDEWPKSECGGPIFRDRGRRAEPRSWGRKSVTGDEPRMVTKDRRPRVERDGIGKKKLEKAEKHFFLRGYQSDLTKIHK